MTEQRTLAEWLAHQQQVHPQAIALGLDRLRVVATRLELRRPARHVITVGGTNGKGSTVAYLESIARSAGHRVGVYTSPHLLRYNERVRIDGVPVDDQPLIDAFERIEAARGDIALTVFEFGTLAALMIFADARLDLAVLEVGLGGRLDAVNLIDADVAIVTTVALDHMEHLGDDREAIGREKAGIFRRRKVAVIGELDPPDSLWKHAQQVGATVKRKGREYKVERRLGGNWRYSDGAYVLDLPPPGLAAHCQVANAAAAITALRALESSLPIADRTYAIGIANARLPGRLTRAMLNGVEVVLDVAHNPQAAQQLARWLAQNRPSGSTHAVFSALGDKDIPHLVGALMNHVDVWKLAGMPDALRGLRIDALWMRVASLLSRSLHTLHVDVPAAFDEACAQAQPGDRIVVFGSFHAVAPILQRLVDAGVVVV